VKRQKRTFSPARGLPAAALVVAAVASAAPFDLLAAGALAVDDGRKPTGAKPGEALRGPGTRP